MSKLYVIGNGFDLHHGLATSYRDFKNHLQVHHREVLDNLNRYYSLENGKDLWSKFEENLANLEKDTLMDFLTEYYDDTSDRGRNPMCPTIDVLKYYAVILSSWMGTTPLNLMVKNSLKYYETKGVIWDSHLRENILFNRKNKQHINTVINELISDIDNILRFKLKNYFDNYYLLLQEKYGKDNSGVNWADFLEYGTSDYQMIELQNIGFSRHLASILLEKHQEYLEFDGEDLLFIDTDKVSTLLKETPVEYREFREVLSLK